MQVAQTIMAQLGGNRFVAMTGASTFVGDDRSLTFKIGRGAANKANRVRISLNDADLYDLTFFSIRGVDVRTVGEVSGVYADRLQAAFKDATGFDTHL